MNLGPTRCLYCGRTVSTNGVRWRVHSVVPNSGERCLLSKQPVPPDGDGPDAYERRVEILGHLACQLRDEDPTLTWTYLTALPDDELQRLALVGIAAVDPEQRVSTMFRWVADLPAARFEVAS